MNNTTTSINSLQAILTEDKSWECYGRFTGKIREDILYRGNSFAIVLATAVSIMTSLSMNFLILCSIYKSRTLQRSSTYLPGILASVNLFAAIFSQLPFLLWKGYILAGIWQRQYTLFCRFVWFVAFMGRVSTLYTITCVFGITLERYIAVIHPHYYRSHKVIVQILKVILCIFLLQTIHVVLNTAFDWYSVVTRFLGLLQIAGVLVFVLIAYAKIHYKLKRLFVYANRPLYQNNMRRQKGLSITSALVVAVFFTCFLPLTIMQGMGHKVEQSNNISMFLEPWLIVFLFMSLSVNPIVYGLRDARLGRCMKNNVKAILNVVFNRNRVYLPPNNHGSGA